MATHLNPTVLRADGRFAAGIEMSDGHTVRSEYKYSTYADAEAAAKDWFEKESAVPAKKATPKKELE